MSGVTPEIIEYLLRASYTHLKTFTEQLNGELSEDAQDEIKNTNAENRQAHATDIEKCLGKLRNVEAHFRKGMSCMNEVKNTSRRLILDINTEVDKDQLQNSIRDNILLLQGSKNNERNGDRRKIDYSDLNEKRVTYLMQAHEDIFNEYQHPLMTDGDERTVENLCKWLEEKQKKSMARMDATVIQNQNESISQQELEQHSQIVDSDDGEGEDLDIRASSYETVPQHIVEELASNEVKLNQIRTMFRQQLVTTPPVHAVNVFNEAMNRSSSPTLEQLPLASKFCSSIMELFSEEAIVIVNSGSKNYVDPITKTRIVNPIRNIICEHVYEREPLLSLLKKKQKIQCPFLGCSNRAFGKTDLEEDEALTETVTKFNEREELRIQAGMQQADENDDTDSGNEAEEVQSDDDTQDINSQEIL